MSKKTGKSAVDNIMELLEAARLGVSDMQYRPFQEVLSDYDAIVLHADEKNIGFERAEKDLGCVFNASDKWVMVRHHIEASSFNINVLEAARSLRFKFTHVEKRVRVLLLLREEAYENGNANVTVADIIEKWGFPTSVYDATMRMLVYLSVLMTEGNEVEARNMAGYANTATIDEWKKYPEFRLLYREAIDRSVSRLEDRLASIAASADRDASSVAAAKLLLERMERTRFAELYDSLDPDGRKRELKKRAFVLAADKGTNIKEALKLEDPEEFGGLDDVTINLPPELLGKINADAPTHLLLQMQALLEQYKKNSGA